MHTRHNWPLAMLVPAAIFAAGCQAAEQPAQATTADPVSVPDVPKPDPWVTTQVQARFFAEPAIRSNQVDVSTEEGVVSLKGTVPSEEARVAATTIAQQVEGVTRVDNRLVVAAGPPAVPPATSQAERAPDTLSEQIDAAWTTTTIQAQYFADSGVKGRNIDVTTDANGTVTLRGQVDSESARHDAMRIAKQTAGVRQVVDQLRVEPAAQPAGDTASGVVAGLDDGWITAKIQSKYFVDPDVKGRDIDVVTKQGIVTLTGTVEKPSERRQAVDIARNTDGVREVKDQLTLRAVTALTGQPGGAGAAVDASTDAGKTVAPPDGWITTTIQSKFFRSGDLRDQPVRVTTSKGVVTLRGQVDTQEAHGAAAEIALGTKGVRRVVNELSVGPAGS